MELHIPLLHLKSWGSPFLPQPYLVPPNDNLLPIESDAMIAHDDMMHLRTNDRDHFPR
jgi:hypothetical protein